MNALCSWRHRSNVMRHLIGGGGRLDGNTLAPDDLTDQSSLPVASVRLTFHSFAKRRRWLN